MALALILSSTGAAKATVAAPDCESYAADAARAEGIPEGVLPAISRVESARKGKAWPWTLNQGGDSSYHATKAEALDRLAQILATGETNVDLGCMQLNWRWHSEAFPDAETMMDPVENTRYAARFLRSLKDRHGDWDSAVAAYHSNQPDRGAAYSAKVEVARNQIEDGQDTPMPDAPTEFPTEGGEAEPIRVAVAVSVRGLLALSGQPLIAQAEPDDLRATRGTGGLFGQP